MRSMSGAIQDLPFREAHFMFLGEAPRNVRHREGAEKRRARAVLLRLGFRRALGSRALRAPRASRSCVTSSRSWRTITAASRRERRVPRPITPRTSRARAALRMKSGMARWKRRASATCRRGRARIRRRSGAPRKLRARERQYVSGVRARSSPRARAGSPDRAGSALHRE